MNVDEQITYWTKLAASNWKTAQNLFDTRRYVHALFFGHLYLECLLKALIVQRTSEYAPFGHKLYTLAQQAGLELTDEQHDLMTRFTAYNIITRYPDERLALYKRLNRKFTNSELKEIRRIGKWLQTQIR